MSENYGCTWTVPDRERLKILNIMQHDSEREHTRDFLDRYKLARN